MFADCVRGRFGNPRVVVGQQREQCPVRRRAPHRRRELARAQPDPGVGVARGGAPRRRAPRARCGPYEYREGERAHAWIVVVHRGLELIDVGNRRELRGATRVVHEVDGTCESLQSRGPPADAITTGPAASGGTPGRPYGGLNAAAGVVGRGGTGPGRSRHTGARPTRETHGGLNPATGHSQPERA